MQLSNVMAENVDPAPTPPQGPSVPPSPVKQAAGPPAKGRIKPSWEYTEYPDVEPQDEQDDSYRNGPKGFSGGVTQANVVAGKRERVKPKALEITYFTPAARSSIKPKKKKVPRQGPQSNEEEPEPQMTLLSKGTMSRGPLNKVPKTLSEMYPGIKLTEEWMERATERMDTRMDADMAAKFSAVVDYAGSFPRLISSEGFEQLRRMWTVCHCVPGEGSSQEPLYGEINLTGVCQLFAVWKELCGFTDASQFLDVGSGLGKMVFHAAVDPGVVQSHGIELSEYRHQSAVSIVERLLPKAQLGHLSERVTLRHADVKAELSWEGITHIYMFDLGFPAVQEKGPYPHILKLWEESETAQYLISYRKPMFLWQRGFNLRLVSRLRVKQQGSGGGSHLAYFYQKM